MKTTSTRGVTRKAPRGIPQPRKSRRIQKPGYLKRPELGFVDRLLRSFHQVAPEEWIPSQYQNLLKSKRGRTKTLH
ncbi:MAG: hypothetical protein U1F66_09240 [bacterium]